MCVCVCVCKGMCTLEIYTHLRIPFSQSTCTNKKTEGYLIVNIANMSNY